MDQPTYCIITCLSINQSNYLFILPSIYLSIYLNLMTCLTYYQYMYLSIYAYIYLSIYLNIFPTLAKLDMVTNEFIEHIILNNLQI